MSEWWVNDTGSNLLAGVEGDSRNPPKLPWEMIAEFLRIYPQARSSFERLLPNMLPEEQDRLLEIAGYARHTNKDELEELDNFQASQNKEGVYTVGRLGGTRIGGNL